MKQLVGPHQIEMEKMGFRDDETNIWWPKFKCPKCNKMFFAFLEDIVLGTVYECPQCGKYEPIFLEEKEQQQRKIKSIHNKMVQSNLIIDAKQKTLLRQISMQKINEQVQSYCASQGELIICKILQKHHIHFYPQYCFDDCINPITKKILYFDFYLPNYNCCIEYDGEQHYKEKKFFGGEDYLKKQQYRDNIKNEYCKKNNIKLIRIKYNCKNIETYLLQELL